MSVVEARTERKATAMVLDATNYAVRTLGADAWEAEARRVKDVLAGVEGVEVKRLERGRMQLSVKAFNANREERVIMMLRRALPSWNFSQQSNYSLPETFGLREIR